MKNIMKTTILMVVLLASVALLAGCGLFHNEHTGGEATCTEWGKCTVCGEEYIEPTGQHTGGEATCGAWGVCTVCGAEYVEPSGQHTGGEATCGAWGVCTVCGEEYIEPTGQHTGGVATCAKWGVCTKCGVAYIEPTGHTEIIDAAVDATCTTTGLTEGKHCSVCNITIIAQNVVNARHSYDNDNDIDCNSCGAKRSVGLEYALLSDDTYAVVGIGSCTDKDIIIPDYYSGKPVTMVGLTVNWEDADESTQEKAAIFSSTGITSVVIPDTVTTIGDLAFYMCADLTLATIGKNVENMGRGVFAFCTSLQEIIIPDKVTSIGYGAFMQCTNLKKAVVGNGVQIIDDVAFGGCTSLTSVTIGDSVTSIGYDAFYECTSLTSIIIPDSVTSIGNAAFHYCTSLKSVTIGNGITNIGSNAFDGTSLQCNEYDNTYYLGNDDNPYLCLVKVKDKSITSYTVRNDTKVIYDSAFQRCTSLTSITIPESVTNIGENAFDEYLESLEAVYITDIRAWCEISFEDFCSNPLSYAKKLYLNGELVTELVIPFEITTIKDYAFRNCTSLTSITIPDSVTSVGSSAFSGCTSLTSITIPDSVTSIGGNAFYMCRNLKEITFNGTVAEWNAINKRYNWNYNIPATEVICSDGVVEI